MSLATRIYLWLGVPRPFDAQHRYVTSYLLPPFYLFLWRATVGLYALFACIYTAARDGGSTFSYFTNMCYFGLAGYFLASAAHTLSFWLSLRRWQRSRSSSSSSSSPSSDSSMAAAEYDEKKAGTVSSHGAEEAGEAPPRSSASYPRSWLDSFPRPLQAAHALLVSTLTTYPLIVTIVYWLLLGNGTSFRTAYTSYSNMSKHALNLAVAVTDAVILGRAPMRPWWHLLAVVVMIASYIGVAYITHATQGFYTYDFLDLSKHSSGVVAAYIIGIGVGTVVSFMIGQLLIFLREWVAARIQKSGGWGSARVAGVVDDAFVPTPRGPGPEGEGGKRTEESQWRGRWPASAAE